MRDCLVICVFHSFFIMAGDTLFVHPQYPPIVYQNGEYNFYKYNPKYIPENMLHCYKILGTLGNEVLQRFKERSKEEVLERGIFDRGYRIRKEFCLQSYSAFSQSFHQRGMYSPFVMESFILLTFHDYLNGKKIDWRLNKKLALEERKDDNKRWKKYTNKMYRAYRDNRVEEKTVPEDMVNEEDWFFNY